MLTLAVLKKVTKYEQKSRELKLERPIFQTPITIPVEKFSDDSEAKVPLITGGDSFDDSSLDSQRSLTETKHTSTKHSKLSINQRSLKKTRAANQVFRNPSFLQASAQPKKGIKIKRNKSVRKRMLSAHYLNNEEKNRKSTTSSTYKGSFIPNEKSGKTYGAQSLLPPISKGKLKSKSNNSKIGLSTEVNKSGLVQRSVSKNPLGSKKGESKHRRLSDYIYDCSYNTLKK